MFVSNNYTDFRHHTKFLIKSKSVFKSNSSKWPKINGFRKKKNWIYESWYNNANIMNAIIFVLTNTGKLLSSLVIILTLINKLNIKCWGLPTTPLLTNCAKQDAPKERHFMLVHISLSEMVMNRSNWNWLCNTMSKLTLKLGRKKTTISDSRGLKFVGIAQHYSSKELSVQNHLHDQPDTANPSRLGPVHPVDWQQQFGKYEVL